MDINFAFRVAIQDGNLEIIKYLMFSKSLNPTDNINVTQSGLKILNRPNRKFIIAAQYNNINIIKYLIKYGENIHRYNDNALRTAIKYGNGNQSNTVEVVKYLIQVGANLHAKNDYALRFAAEKGYLEVVKYLIQIGANIYILTNKQKLKYNLI